MVVHSPHRMSTPTVPPPLPHSLCARPCPPTASWIFRGSIGKVWSRGDDVVLYVADTMFAYLCSAIVSSFVLVLERILDGMAYPNLVAYVSAIGQPWVLVLLASGYLEQQVGSGRGCG